MTIPTILRISATACQSTPEQFVFMSNFIFIENPLGEIFLLKKNEWPQCEPHCPR